MKKKLIIAYITLFSAACFATKTNAQNEAGLKDALAGKFLIGVALSARQISSQDPRTVELVRKHFAAIVPENCMKPALTEPKEGQFTFDDADRFVAFGEQNHLWMTGHCLVWHSQVPAWFFVDQDGKEVSRDTLIARMKNHITTVVSRYKGRIKGWDVVNEAFNDDGTPRESKWYKIIGPDYISLAFKFAHEADPDAELYYNDYDEWYAVKRDAIVKMVKQLKAAGLRIDAVGMQGHIDMEYPTLEDYKAAIDAYTSAGVKVMITEFDMSALPAPRNRAGANVSDLVAYRAEMNPYTNGLPDSVSEAWTKRMASFFKLFLDNQDKIERVTMWGLSDAGSWKNGFPMRGRTDYPLLFDRNYQPKPVVKEIIKRANEK